MPNEQPDHLVAVFVKLNECVSAHDAKETATKDLRAMAFDPESKAYQCAVMKESELQIAAYRAPGREKNAFRSAST